MIYSHTLGPWHFLLNDETQELDIVDKNENQNIAHVHNENDARLIAAAPDLLEALMNIENDDRKIPETIWKMRNDAIAKATTA